MGKGGGPLGSQPSLWNVALGTSESQEYGLPDRRIGSAVSISGRMRAIVQTIVAANSGRLDPLNGRSG